MRKKTRDAEIFTIQDISRYKSLTPEGFLLCEGVPLAKVGTHLYREEELVNEDGRKLVKGGVDKVCRITRDENALFDPETMMSFNGKPVTLGHPDDWVTPENWQQHAVGEVMNVRRGQGMDSDVMIGDLLIKRADAIDAVMNKNLRQVSNGYDADYEDLGGGYGRQINISGNHVALVGAGRNGSRCSIRDSKGVKTMGKDKKSGVIARLMRAFYTKDEDAFQEEIEGLGEPAPTQAAPVPAPPAQDPTAQKDTALDARLIVLLEKLIGMLEGQSAPAAPAAPAPAPAPSPAPAEAPTEDEEIPEDELEGYTVDTVSGAEVLSPGMKMETKDSRSVVTHRREALSRFAKTKDGASLNINGLFGDAASMKRKTLDAAFSMAVQVMRAKKSHVATHDHRKAMTKDTRTRIAEINKANSAFWAKGDKV